jgi:hypothetical protein
MEVEGDVENFDDNYSDDGWCWWGSLQPVGGQTEREKHAELVELLPQLVVVTRWRWVDELLSRTTLNENRILLTQG